MARVARRIEDKRLLHLIRRYLQSGLMKHGIKVESIEGTPQGGPLSPLLANILLDELDKELASRGHKFCRYADDCNIYVRSQAAGDRVMSSVTKFLETRLRLKVNKEKSAVAHVEERQFLGHRLLRGGRLGIAPKAIKKAKARLRQITKRHRGISLEQMVTELNKYTIGWVTYFRHAQVKTLLRGLDQWIRRRVRCFRLVQMKQRYTVVKWLMHHGVPPREAWHAVMYGFKGWWRLSSKKAISLAMTVTWFRGLGLVSLEERFVALKA
jgi:RNA-directed DNA polymerase